MNSRGPLPQFDSRRGLEGTNGAAAEFVQEQLDTPACLKTKKLKDEFRRIVDLQIAAGVGVRRADAEQYAEYVQLVADFWEANSPNDRQSARRVMTAMEDQLVIGERARQRVGIRGKKVQAKSKLALMVAKSGTTDTP